MGIYPPASAFVDTSSTEVETAHARHPIHNHSYSSRPPLYEPIQQAGAIEFTKCWCVHSSGVLLQARGGGRHLRPAPQRPSKLAGRGGSDLRRHFVRGYCWRQTVGVKEERASHSALRGGCRQNQSPHGVVCLSHSRLMSEKADRFQSLGSEYESGVEGAFLSRRFIGDGAGRSIIWNLDSECL